MTTVADARAEMIDALKTAGVAAGPTPGEPPYIYVAGDGIEPTRVVAGQADATFRLVMIGGAWDEAAAAAELDVLKQAALTTVRGMAAWAMGAISRDGGREWNGSLYLTADMAASRRIDI